MASVTTTTLPPLKWLIEQCKYINEVEAIDGNHMICGRCKVGIIQSRMDGYLGNEKDFNKLSTREYGFLEQPSK